MEDRDLGKQAVLVNTMSDGIMLSSIIELAEVMQRLDGSVYLKDKPEAIVTTDAGPTWTYTATVEWV